MQGVARSRAVPRIGDPMDMKQALTVLAVLIAYDWFVKPIIFRA